MFLTLNFLHLLKIFLYCLSSLLMAYNSVCGITQFDYNCNLQENTVNFTIYDLKRPSSRWCTINRPSLVSCTQEVCLMRETLPLKPHSRQLMVLWHVSTYSANVWPGYSFEFRETRHDKDYQWTGQTRLYKNTSNTQVVILMRQISHSRENWCITQISIFINSPVEIQNISPNRSVTKRFCCFLQEATDENHRDQYMAD